MNDSRVRSSIAGDPSNRRTSTRAAPHTTATKCTRVRERSTRLGPPATSKNRVAAADWGRLGRGAAGRPPRVRSWVEGWSRRERCRGQGSLQAQPRGQSPPPPQFACYVGLVGQRAARSDASCLWRCCSGFSSSRSCCCDHRRCCVGCRRQRWISV